MNYYKMNKDQFEWIVIVVDSPIQSRQQNH